MVKGAMNDNRTHARFWRGIIGTAIVALAVLAVVVATRLA
jgi:anti-sigma-K factor RskA